MKSKVVFYSCIASLLLISCQSNEKKPVPPDSVTTTVPEDTTSIEISDSVFDVETIDTFNTTGFSDYAKKQFTGFDWSRFRLSSTWIDDSLMTIPYTPDKKFYDTYGRFVRYSPDSSQFIDLDSYNIHIQKDDKGRLTGRESGPDSEVSLVDLKNNRKTRLVFLGPDGSVEDGLWLDKETLVIMGVHDYKDSTGKLAAVWKIHVPTHTFYLYELKDDSGAAAKIMGYWRKERLKGVSEK